MNDIRTIFSEENKVVIESAIREAEFNRSGEIRLHVENRCRIDVLDQAAYIFKKLEMHKTELRNGVLFYLAIKDRKFAILGDAGINAKVQDDFWDDIKDLVQKQFKDGKFVEGLEDGIRMAGEQLKHHFPHTSDDQNELNDEISFGS